MKMLKRSEETLETANKTNGSMEKKNADNNMQQTTDLRAM